jgi:hypothetical protein
LDAKGIPKDRNHNLRVSINFFATSGVSASACIHIFEFLCIVEEPRLITGYDESPSAIFGLGKE